MRSVWTSQQIDVPAPIAWRWLTDPAMWPVWGPSVRAAVIEGGDGVLSQACQGRVTTAIGIDLPFEVTGFEAGRYWAWSVAGVPATEHRVDPVSPQSCLVSFGVPWVAAPYLAVCRVALARLDVLAAAEAAQRAEDP